MAKNKEQKLGMINMNGTAKRTVPYNLMEITLTFNVRECSPKQALETLDDQCENLLQEMKAYGITLKDITIGENEVSRYQEGAVPFGLKDELEEKCVDVDWSKYDAFAEASRKLKLKLAFDMKIRNMIDQIVVNQGLEVEINTKYMLSNEAEIRQELLREAVANSKAMAEMLAESAGQKIVGVKEIIKQRDYEPEFDLACCVSAMPVVKPRLLDEVSADSETLEESIGIVWLIK